MQFCFFSVLFLLFDSALKFNSRIFEECEIIELNPMFIVWLSKREDQKNPTDVDLNNSVIISPDLLKLKKDYSFSMSY